MLNTHFSKIVITIFITISFIACKNNTTSKNMDIIFEASDYPVVLRYSTKHQYIWRVDFPIKATFKNKSFLRKTLNEVNFNFDKSADYRPYIHDKNNTHVRIYDEKNTHLKRSSIRKYIYYNEPKEFIIYPFIKLDTTQNNQTLYRRYREIMLQNEADSLVIGTVKELNIKHPELIHFFNKGELYFQFGRNKSVHADEVHKLISF